jgi:hypothetical protein
MHKIRVFWLAAACAKCFGLQSEKIEVGSIIAVKLTLRILEAAMLFFTHVSRTKWTAPMLGATKRAIYTL